MTLPVRLHEPVRLGRGRRWLTYGIGGGLWASGAIWLLYHYFMQRHTLFGLAEDPLTHWWLVGHAFFAFAALWLFGLLWGQHIVGAWKTRRHRISGSALFAVLTVLIASGYLLYYAGGDETRAIDSLVHWSIGLSLPALFVWHRFARKLPRPSRHERRMRKLRHARTKE